jgi:hypothetical protein
VPIPNNQLRVCEAQFQGIGNAGGSDSKNFLATFHFRRTTVTNVPDETAFKNACLTQMQVSYAAMMPTRYTLKTLGVRFIDDASRQQIPYTINAGGAITGDTMPMHVSSMILIRTPLRGKNFRGSKHFGPIPESASTTGTDDVMNAAYIVLANAFMTAWIAGFTDVNSNVWVPTLLSRNLSQLKINPTTVSTQDISLLLLNKRFGRMRKREVKSIY